MSHSRHRNIQTFGASCSTVLWPSSRAMAAPTPLVVHRVKMPPDTFTSCRVSFNRSQAQRPGQAQRKRGVGGHNLTYTHAEESQAEHNGQAEWNGVGGGFGVFSDYDTAQYALAQKKARRCGHAERSESGGVEGPPRLRQSNSHARRRRPSRAQRPGRVEQKRGVWGYSPTTARHSTPARRKKPSAAARPCAAEKRGFGVSRLRQSNFRARQIRPSRAQRPGRSQPKELSFRPQQQPTHSQSKNKLRETLCLQDKGTIRALLSIRAKQNCGMCGTIFDDMIHSRGSKKYPVQQRPHFSFV